MQLTFELTIAQVKVVSAIASNFAVVWFAAIFATNDFLVLLGDIFFAFFAIVSTRIAIRAEELLENI